MAASLALQYNADRTRHAYYLQIRRTMGFGPV